MTFLKRIAETMIQRNVILNDGRMGRVVMINKYKLSCPLVQVGTLCRSRKTKPVLHSGDT
ncbi:MAG: hypothetical protein ACLS6A_14330 [Roseburia intestinalis]